MTGTSEGTEALSPEGQTGADARPGSEDPQATARKPFLAGRTEGQARRRAREVRSGGGAVSGGDRGLEVVEPAAPGLPLAWTARTGQGRQVGAGKAGAWAPPRLGSLGVQIRSAGSPG